MKLTRNLLIVLPLALMVLAGCGKKADTSKPIDEIRKEVETMSAKDLEGTAKAYAREIQAQTQELDKVKEKLKGFSPKDLFSEKAKAIKEEVESASKELGELTKRFDIYAKEFEAKGGNISSLKTA